MARWRAAAIERLPSLRPTIAAADNIMALWIELTMAFEDAYRAEPWDEALIAGVYSFADWCFAAGRHENAEHDPTSAVMVAFLEDIPNTAASRQDLPRWLTYDEVARSKDVFAYMIGEKAFDELVLHMHRHRSKYVRRARDGRWPPELE